MILRPAPSLVRFPLCGLALGLLVAVAPATADEAAGPLVAKALEVMADLTLIDGACRGETVNFGVGFGFASRQGLPEVTLMPGGTRRADFEAVLRARRASFSRDELCGEIAENYAEALPGSVTFGNGTPQRP